MREFRCTRPAGRFFLREYVSRRCLLWLLPLLLLGGCTTTVDGDTRLAWNGSRGLLAVSTFTPLGQPDAVRLISFALADDSGKVAEPKPEGGIPAAAEGGTQDRAISQRPAREPVQHVVAEELGEYRGLLAGIVGVDNDFLLVFRDGTLMRQGKQRLLPVADGENRLRFLNAVGTSTALYALQADAGQLRVYRYAGSQKAKVRPVVPEPGRKTPAGTQPQNPGSQPEEEPSIKPGTMVADAGTGWTGDGAPVPAEGWEAYGPPLPQLTPVAMAELTLLGGEPAIFMRSLLRDEVEPGVKAALLTRTAGELGWQWLPAPTGPLASGVLAVSSYQDGVLLLQEPGNREGEPQQGTASFYDRAGGWRACAPVQQFQHDRWQPAQSLTVAAGGERAFVVRIGNAGMEAYTTIRPAEPGWLRLPLPGTQTQAGLPVWVIPVTVFVLSLLILRVMRGRLLAEMARRKAAGEQIAQGTVASVIDIERSASPVDRAVAMLVDMLLVSPLPIFYVGSVEGFSQGVFQGQGVVAYLLLLGGLIVYSTAAEALCGQTFGKWLLRLRVRAVEGGRPTFVQVLVRNLLRAIDFFPVMFAGAMIWYLVALIAVTMTRRRQRVGDVIAQTVVRRVVPVGARKIILASGSPRRRILLEELGLSFTVQVADVDETPVPGVPAREMAERLARRKAERVAADAPADAVIIAADTIVVRDGEILGKPTDPEDAKRMLRSLAGREHQVITAVSVIDKATGQFMDGSDLTAVRMRQLTDSEIAEYVASGEPADKAGAYAIQGRGGQFVAGARGSVSNVVGLPVEMLREMLQDLS